MDPLALAAVVGLVFAGKRLSDGAEEQPVTTESRKPLPPVVTRRDTDLMAHPGEHWADYQDVKIMTPELGRRVGDWRLQPKQVVSNMGDAWVTDGKRSPFGQPVYDLYGRQNITNKMNNFPPVERHNVGPGLGVGPDVAATGGFQQFFRVLPHNINEERLVTLDGLPGPRNPVVKNGGAGGLGEVTHKAKATKTWHRPPAQNNGQQAQGGGLRGAEGRPDQIKTRRTTIRDQTGFRGDTLEFGIPHYNVKQPYDGSLTDKSLPHLSNNRSNADRAGNPGRMNVREDPVNAVGAMTNLRSESIAFPVTAPSAGRFQNYIKPEFDKFNEKKTVTGANPWVDTLDIAIKQLEKNSFVQEPLSAQ
jgi:hypothetical protein